MQFLASRALVLFVSSLMAIPHIAYAYAVPAQLDASPCDPDKIDVDQAVVMRDKSQLASSERVLLNVLAKHPNNFRANYTLATVHLESTDALSVRRGIEELVFTLKLKPLQSRSCAIEYGWYSIYNTLGVQLYKIKRYSEAEPYFKTGYAYKDYLFKRDKINLLNNLGLIYFQEGDLVKSKIYYEEALKSGSSIAASRLAAIGSLRD